MDRIDTQGLNGALARLKTRGTAPVARAEAVPSAGDDGAKAGDVTMAAVIVAGAEAPIDHDRVAEIRKAVEEGRYPILPTKIADAMIAAGFLLRKS